MQVYAMVLQMLADGPAFAVKMVSVAAKAAAPAVSPEGKDSQAARPWERYLGKAERL